MRRTSSTLIAIVLALLSFGIVMLASTSSVEGSAHFDDPHHFLKRQLTWLAVSVVVGAIIFCFDYHWWKKKSVAVLLTLISVVLLVLVFVPRIGVMAGGSRRWLGLGMFSFQPSEIAKFSLVIVLASWLAGIGRRVRHFREGILFPVIGLSVILGLMIAEPDFGTTLLTGMVGMIIMFAAGARLNYLFIMASLGGGCFAVAVMSAPLRMDRIRALFAPEKYPATAYHLAQSKIAFIRGEWLGVGLGNSIQKQLYLPEAHTDFIFAIIGEELGFLATCSVVLLFIGFLICGMIISFRAPDPFGRLLAFGLTIMIVLQAAINIGVVTGCLPTKGLPLPFISYGGTSLLVSIVCVGVVLNIARHCAEGHADDHTRLIKDRGHRF